MSTSFNFILVYIIQRSLLSLSGGLALVTTSNMADEQSIYVSNTSQLRDDYIFPYALAAFGLSGVIMCIIPFLLLANLLSRFYMHTKLFMHAPNVEKDPDNTGSEQQTHARETPVAGTEISLSSVTQQATEVNPAFVVTQPVPIAGFTGSDEGVPIVVANPCPHNQPAPYSSQVYTIQGTPSMDHIAHA